MMLWWVAAFAWAKPPEMIPVEAMEPQVLHAAPLSLPLRGGGNFDLESHRGRVVVLSFWASWCAPCRLELPALSEYAKSRTDVDFIAINVDRTQPAAEKFLRQVNVGLPIAFDPNAIFMGKYGVTSMPTTFVIGKSGDVFNKKVGYSQENGLTELIGYIDGASR